MFGRKKTQDFEVWAVTREGTKPPGGPVLMVAGLTKNEADDVAYHLGYQGDMVSTFVRRTGETPTPPAPKDLG